MEYLNFIRYNLKIEVTNHFFGAFVVHDGSGVSFGFYSFQGTFRAGFTDHIVVIQLAVHVRGSIPNTVEDLGHFFRVHTCKQKTFRFFLIKCNKWRSKLLI